MKKLLILPALLLALAACDSENEFHQTSFDKTGVVMYADQVKDSVLLYYSDDWASTLNDASWLSVTPNSGKMEKGAMLMATPLYFTAEANTSGRVRYANLTIHSHEQGGITITQLPVLNIIFPYYQFKEGTEFTKDNLLFIGYYSGEITEGKVIFTVYRDDATLTSDQEWVTPEETSFKAGKHEVKLTLQPNPDIEMRTATLTLNSGGVSTDIIINQDKAVED